MMLISTGPTDEYPNRTLRLLYKGSSYKREPLTHYKADHYKVDFDERF